jgi:hypothetical protein
MESEVRAILAEAVRPPAAAAGLFRALLAASARSTSEVPHAHRDRWDGDVDRLASEGRRGADSKVPVLKRGCPVRKSQRLRKAAEDLMLAADGDLDGPELDDVRERLADSLVLLEYRLRPKPSRLGLLGFVAGVAGVAGAGVLLWRYRRRLRRQLEELGGAGPQIKRAIVTGREAVERAVPPDLQAVRGRLRTVRGDSRPADEEGADRA